jgi:predicted amidohydrolase
MKLKPVFPIIILFFFSVTGLSEINFSDRQIKLAMAQMLVEGGNKKANLERAVERISVASKNGAQIIVLPEVMDVGWTHSSALTEAGPVPGGATFKVLAKAARDNKIYVCAGITEREKSEIYNTAVLINPKGELILKHRKINELDIAHHLYGQGDKINVCKTEFGNIGLLICADARAKDYMLTRSMGYLGAELILLPSSWAVKPDFDNDKTPYNKSGWKEAFDVVCKEFNLNVVAVSNVGAVVDGPWEGWKCIGNSLYVGNNAEEYTELPYGEKADTIVYQTVVLKARPARGTSWSKYWRDNKM